MFQKDTFKKIFQGAIVGIFGKKNNRMEITTEIKWTETFPDENLVQIRGKKQIYR